MLVLFESEEFFRIDFGYVVVVVVTGLLSAFVSLMILVGGCGFFGSDTDFRIGFKGGALRTLLDVTNFSSFASCLLGLVLDEMWDGTGLIEFSVPLEMDTLGATEWLLVVVELLPDIFPSPTLFEVLFLSIP